MVNVLLFKILEESYLEHLSYRSNYELSQSRCELAVLQTKSIWCNASALIMVKHDIHTPSSFTLCVSCKATAQINCEKLALQMNNDGDLK